MPPAADTRLGDGVAAADMQTVAVLARAAVLGIGAAAVLVVTDSAGSGATFPRKTRRAGRAQRRKSRLQNPILSTLKLKVRLRCFRLSGEAFGLSGPWPLARRTWLTSRPTRSSWSSTSSRRWEKDRSRLSSRSTSPAEGRLRAASAACWASAAFSRAPKAAASAFSSIWLSSSAWASSPITCSLRPLRLSWSSNSSVMDGSLTSTSEQPEILPHSMPAQTMIKALLGGAAIRCGPPSERVAWSSLLWGGALG